MKTKQIRITLDEALANFDELCNEVTSKKIVAIIKRPKGDNVALVAANELSSLLETLYLLRTPRNATRLLAALSRAKRS